MREGEGAKSVGEDRTLTLSRPDVVVRSSRALGARDWRIFRSVIFPAIFPAFLAGCALAFARSLGEFGAVVFIAGNLPFQTEVASLLAYIRLEEYDYEGAAAIALVLMVLALALLFVSNLIQLRAARYGAVTA